MSDSDAAVVRLIAQRLEELAAELEGTMPRVRRARQALTDVSPAAARRSEFAGSPEELESAAAEGYGFAAVERARRRILAAIREPFDDLEDRLT